MNKKKLIKVLKDQSWRWNRVEKLVGSQPLDRVWTRVWAPAANQVWDRISKQVWSEVAKRVQIPVDNRVANEVRVRAERRIRQGL